jgi:Ca2+-binding RTX toxin-like protein
VRLRALFVSASAVCLMVAPAFANGITGSVAGGRTECTITGTAADDTLAGTTRDDVICGKAGSDSVDALEGNDVVRGGQGDDGNGCVPVRSGIVRQCVNTAPIRRGSVTRGSFLTFGLNGGDGSDVVKGQQDDDSIEGNDQNDKLYGGQGDDCLGAQCTTTDSENGNDLLKSRDKVSGNDYVDGGNNTDTCRIDAGDQALSCEL